MQPILTSWTPFFSFFDAHLRSGCPTDQSEQRIRGKGGDMGKRLQAID